MICEACHGTSTVPPCAACGGCGVAHCCDGLVAADAILESEKVLGVERGTAVVDGREVFFQLKDDGSVPVALQRIIDEVRAEKDARLDRIAGHLGTSGPKLVEELRESPLLNGYNRVYHRHNR